MLIRNASHYLAVFLLLLAPLLVSAEKWLSEKAFTERFVTQLQSTLPELHINDAEPLTIEAQLAEDEQISIYLDNAYQAYRSGQRSLNEAIGDQIASLSESINNQLDPALEPSQIMPVIKSMDYVLSVEQDMKNRGAKLDGPLFHSKQLNDDLAVLYVLDTPTSMRFLRPKDLVTLDLNAEQLHAKAISNLANYYQESASHTGLLETHGKGELYITEIDDVYEAAMLLTNLPASLSLSGDPVAFLPARNVLLIVSSTDTEGLALARQISAMAYNDMPYSISPHGYRSQNGRWLRFD